MIRRWRLRHPCEVDFLILPRDQGSHAYAIQDNKEHRVKELILPPNGVFEIEIIYLPKLPFFESKVAFGCEKVDPGKPYAIERFNRFIESGKSHWVPGHDPEDALTRTKMYWAKREEHRPIGTGIILGFKLKTKNVGTYPMILAFVTDEVEGSAMLTIRVEDPAKTPMVCCKKGHSKCFVYPP